MAALGGDWRAQILGKISIVALTSWEAHHCRSTVLRLAVQVPNSGTTNEKLLPPRRPLSSAEFAEGEGRLERAFPERVDQQNPPLHAFGESGK